MDSLTINMPITTRYKCVVEAVRQNRSFGMDHEQAVEKAIVDHQYLLVFVPEDEAALRAWFGNKLVA